MSVIFAGERSTTDDSVGPPSDNCGLTTTTAIPLVNVGLLQEELLSEFTFIVNDKRFAPSVVEAVLLSPAVCGQLEVDACARRCVIGDSKIDPTDFSSLQSLLSGVEFVLQKSRQKLLVLIRQQFGNVGIERFFFSLWSNSTANSAVTVSIAFAAHSHVYLQSVSELSLLSVDALDSLLWSEPFCVDNEDALLRILVPLGHPLLLRPIQWEFESNAAISALCEDPTESLWLVVPDRLMTPPPLIAFNSLIVSDFPPVFEEFRMKRFNLSWRGSRDGFTASEFHHRRNGHVNTLAFIFDTVGNVFGGFTLVKWESAIETSATTAWGVSSSRGGIHTSSRRGHCSRRVSNRLIVRHRCPNNPGR
jgi:hypothetical protein